MTESMPNEWWSARQWSDLYRSYGLAVIPAVLSADGKKKHPAGRWQEFQENGIPQAVHEKWFDGPSKLMGFLTGKACFDADTGLVVIDVDIKDGKRGDLTWHAWLTVHNSGIQIETWIARTGSGGLHYYFKAPVDRLPHNTQETIDGIDVRGVGGFIMAPPSPHYIPGTDYEWMDGYSPWETDIADAPDWLLDELHSIAEVSLARTSRVTQTDTPDRCEDVFGNTIDGRDKKLADYAYRAMLDAYRLCPIKPVLADLDDIVKAAFDTYVATTDSRIPKDGRSRADRLEAEGRGITAFREKVARHYRTWDDRLAKAARSIPRHIAERKAKDDEGRRVLAQVLDWMREDGHPDTPWLEDLLSRPFEQEQPKAEQAEAPRPTGPVVIQTTAQFVQEWAPKPFVLKPVLEQGRLYTATGKTGTGKTAIALLIALHIARGIELAGRRVKQCDVLFLAGENHEDVRTRWLTMLKLEGIDPATVGVHFVGGRFSIEGHFDVVKAHLEKHATGIVIVDTLQAFFDGDDSNSNEQMKALAHVLRRISNLGPAVLVPAHPTKSATKDNNVPYGGGALLNEIDGNLSLWGDAEAVELSWCGKFRGSFEPLTFALDVVEMPGVKDADGDPIRTVKARVVSTLEAEMKAQQHGQALRKLLFLINEHPGASERNLVKLFSDRFPDEPRGRGTVQRRLGELVAEKMVEKTLGHWRLTAKGAKFIGVRHGEE
jgi:hypothetical protein